MSKMGHKATADNMEYCVFLMACYAIYISSVIKNNNITI